MIRPHNIFPDQFTVERPAQHYCDRLNQYVLQLHNELLPRLRLFPTFDVFFVTRLRNNGLGGYMPGTQRWPVVLISIPACERFSAVSKIPVYELIETTVLHELGHAIQNWYGLRFVENDAENFARRFYYQNSQIMRFWT